jgi:dienelactone hydrolase
MKFALLLIAITMFCSSAFANPISEEVPYTQEGKTFHGVLAYDNAQKGPRPGVLVVHEWWGLNEFVKQKAMEIASLGYVVFAADMYGDGATTDDPQVANKWSGEVKGVPLMRSRANYALELLKKNPRVDARRVGAIGFCFGGTTVLELAWSGADLAGVVSFHGGLTSPKPEDVETIKAKVLVLHGAEDPFEKPEVITDFQNTLGKAKVDWQMVIYGGAMHSFTNPNADSHHIKGVAYNEKAASRSWKHMELFFRELFGQ